MAREIGSKSGVQTANREWSWKASYHKGVQEGRQEVMAEEVK
jgi:hypothetical protein